MTNESSVRDALMLAKKGLDKHRAKTSYNGEDHLMVALVTMQGVQLDLMYQLLQTIQNKETRFSVN